MSTVEYNAVECFPKQRFVVAKDEAAQFVGHVVEQWWLDIESEAAPQPKPKTKQGSSYIVSYAPQTPDLSMFPRGGKSLAEQKAERLARAIQQGKEAGLIPHDAPPTRESFEASFSSKMPSHEVLVQTATRVPDSFAGQTKDASK